MPSQMSWHCQASFQGSCGSLVPSDTKSCIREFPKTGFIVYKAADGKSLGMKIIQGMSILVELQRPYLG